MQHKVVKEMREVAIDLIIFVLAPSLSKSSPLM